VSKSNLKPTHRILAALTLHKLSVPKLAKKHGVSDKTLYAALSGARPGKDERVKRAVAEAHRAEEALANV
jgi:lambda repressor-like predicted transcriptional regulator